jgi:hypothetical protein
LDAQFRPDLAKSPSQQMQALKEGATLSGISWND